MLPDADDTGTVSRSDADAGERRCPDCGSQHVVPDGGCQTCRACGWSRCAYSPA